MNEKTKDLIRRLIIIISIIIIALFAYSITPKTFQNDTFYTIKIGEHIIQNTDKITDLLPWNKGLDMKDPFSWHENLPYTYPHWLYDVATYGIYSIGGFKGIYYTTCILSITLGLVIFGINKKLNKSTILSFFMTIASLYCLKNFITARAQLVTFILFALTYFFIERFLETKKIRYAISLIVIPIIIANVHCAVWPFYFVLYLPFIAEQLIYFITTADYKNLYERTILFFKKRKISEKEFCDKKNGLKEQKEIHEKKVKENMSNLYKFKFDKEKNIKWLILIVVICAFTGLITPIKGTPYTYLIKTNEGNTTQNISEHLPLTLVKNDNMMVILTILLGILILLKLICDLYDAIKLKVKSESQKNTYFIATISVFSVVAILICGMSFKGCNEKKHDSYVDDKSYPVSASNYIINDLIPKVGVEKLRLYNEYNYGSYLLFRGIPVFIDSRADLYAPEFNGKKNSEGEYDGRDIFTDFLDISSLAANYENEFENYDVTHVITYSNSKLNSLIAKDSNYEELYDDGRFTIYERLSANDNEVN